MKDIPTFLRPAGERVRDFLVRHHAPPDGLTLASLAVSALAALAFAWGLLAAGGVLVLCSGALDLFDGRVARATGTTTARGALLDSVCDRYAELLVYGGIAIHFTHWSRHAAPGGAPRIDTAALALTLAALAGALMVSYVRARAGALGVQLASVGLAQRPERILVLAVGAVLASLFGGGILKLALALIAVTANVTAISRLRHAARALAPRPSKAPQPSENEASAAISSRPLPG